MANNAHLFIVVVPGVGPVGNATAHPKYLNVFTMTVPPLGVITNASVAKRVVTPQPLGVASVIGGSGPTETAAVF